MGNAHPGSTLTRTSSAVDSFVAELGNDIIYEKSTGSARFLKSVKCRHRNGYLLVKIFIKPDPGLSLRSYIRRLKVERDALLDLPNVYNHQCFVETDKAGYIIRQWTASNLYDRISTRPFLSGIEKKWISFQLLHALRDSRNRKIAHGDIKASNILVTSWNWIYVTDFATFKPTYLPLDDPSDFSFFFDTSGRRTCYIAPERFYTALGNPEINARKNANLILQSEMGIGATKKDGKVTEAMDVFSAGCVMAELFLEGAPLFTLSQLFKYREGEFNVDAALMSIEDADVRDTIKQMIALDPEVRPTFDALLHTAQGTVFPESFYSFFHSYVSNINELPSPSPFSFSPPQAANNTTSTITSTPSVSTVRATPSTLMTAQADGVGQSGGDALPSDSDQRIEKIWADYESVEPYLLTQDVDGEATVTRVKMEGVDGMSDSKPFQDVFPVELNIPNRDSKLRTTFQVGPRVISEDGPALIVLALVTSNIRNCVQPTSKVRALDVLLALAVHLTDEAKLDRMAPYIVDLLHDDAAVVRAAAMRTLMQTLMMVTVITPSSAAIFPEYIIPNIKHLVEDPEVSVRCMFAQCIAPLADTALRYLELAQVLKAHGTYKSDQQEYGEAYFEMSYDASLQDLQSNIEELLSNLLFDSASVVKRAVLHNISSLCIFLGRQKTNDLLLSHMITYLNDRDWLLRYAFFESIVDVAACAGGRSLEEYILPLMVQALSDIEETVVAKVLIALTNLCELGLFQKMRIWELLSGTLGFLYHPNIWIRQAAAAFIASAAKHLPSSDVWCILYPSLRHLLRSDIVTVDEQSLLTVVNPPLSRQIFDAAVLWAMRADKTYFWKGGRRVGSKGDSPRESVVSVRKTANTIARNKSEEDEVQIAKLQQLGMTPTEESKLLAMRDYIMKLAHAISSFTTRSSREVEAERNLKTVLNVELQKLGVVPHTVFLKARGLDVTPRSSHVVSPRRPTLETPSRISRTGRIGSLDYGGTGAPFEDLRRRLANINGSAASLPLSIDNRGSSSSPMQPPSSTPSYTIVSGLPLTTERPGSPTESVVSVSNSSALRAQRLQIGSTDGQKAAPAVGSSKTNATGLLETSSKIHSEGSPERSGRSSPIPLGAVRGAHRSHIPPPLRISTYDGQEPGISFILENLYLDNTRELQQDFGPKVHEGPVRRRGSARQSSILRDGNTRRSETTLIAHLPSHSECITGIAVSPDHMFFVSCSDDKTVKIWDTARLERNVTSKPRHTYSQHHARVKCVCILEGVHCFASAAEDGSLHVVRVHVNQSGSLPKYGKVQMVREHRTDHVGEYITCMLHYNTDTASNLLYATSHSVITVLDLRTMRVSQTMENPTHFGPITCMCMDRKRTWIIVGSSGGVLSLWDRRFGLLLRSWKCAAATLGESARIHQCVLHPSKGRGRWIMVAVQTIKPSMDASTTLIEVWDVEKCTLVESYATRSTPVTSNEVEEPLEITGLDAESDPAAAMAALVRSRQAVDKHRPSENLANDEAQPPAPDVRAMVAGLEFGGHSTHRLDISDLNPESSHTSSRPGGRGFLLTGSEDRQVRLWDLDKLERTAILTESEPEYEKPSYSAVRASKGVASIYIETSAQQAGANSQLRRAPQRISQMAHNQQNLLRHHHDVVTALACIDSPFRGGVVSGDRSGVLKVLRVELMDG